MDPTDATDWEATLFGGRGALYLFSGPVGLFCPYVVPMEY